MQLNTLKTTLSLIILGSIAPFASGMDFAMTSGLSSLYIIGTLHSAPPISLAQDSILKDHQTNSPLALCKKAIASNDQNQFQENLRLCSTEDKNHLLRFVCQEKKGDYIQPLVSAGGDINHTFDNRGLLYEALVNKDFLMIITLIKQGIDLNKSNNFGHTPLQIAVLLKSEGLLQLLLSAKPNIDQINTMGNTALILAVKENFDVGVKLLLDNGACPSISDSHEGNTPLILAAQNGLLNYIKLLLHAQSPINQVNYSGYNALHCATGNGKTECVQLLLANGANPNAITIKRDTALMMAALIGHKDCMALLLRAGADINHINKESDSALTWAAENGYVECIELLVQSGSQIDQQNEDGETALMWACVNGNAACVKKLLELGANAHLTNKKGESAYTLALKAKKFDCARLLLNFNFAEIARVIENGKKHTYQPFSSALSQDICSTSSKRQKTSHDPEE